MYGYMIKTLKNCGHHVKDIVSRTNTNKCERPYFGAENWSIQFVRHMDYEYTHALGSVYILDTVAKTQRPHVRIYMLIYFYA